MKEVKGRIVRWDAGSRQGVIKGTDDTLYPFTLNEWEDVQQPEVDGAVLAICEDGRNVSRAEYIGIEHVPVVKVSIIPKGGERQTVIHQRLVGGPWRVRSDALAWMAVAKELHEQNAHLAISDLSALLQGEHPLISLRGSVIKYCYGLAIELYLKWILIEAKREYKTNHKLLQIIKKIPAPVLSKLRGIYSDYQEQAPDFRMMEANVGGVEELDLDWSSFDSFINNIDRQKFIVGRYADPKDYGIFRSISQERSREMNSYMDSIDFFVLGDKLLAYKPSLGDYE